MIIAKQHSEFKLRANKVDSNHYEDILPSQIDSFLNNAALFICNHYGELFEFGKSQFSKDMFGSLLVKYPDQPGLNPSATVGQQHEYELSGLKYKYLHLDRAYVQSDNIVVPVALMRNDEQMKFNDRFQKPSFKWKRLLGNIGKSSTKEAASLYVYSDVSLDEKELRVEYVKVPKPVFFGGYNSIEYLDCKKRKTGGFTTEDCNQFYKKEDTPVNSDLPESYHDIQVDIAVWLATSKTENAFLSNFLSNKLASLPK